MKMGSLSAGLEATGSRLNHPGSPPGIYAVLSSSYDAGISVTRSEGDQEFRFESIDLSGDPTVGTAFIISGLDDGNAQIFSVELPPSYSRASISASDVFQSKPLVNEKVRTLIIVGAHYPGESGQFSIDNIKLTCSALACPDVTGGAPNFPVPEPASLLLLGIGLAGIGVWGQKPVKI
jgi:hypothetical protein